MSFNFLLHYCVWRGPNEDDYLALMYSAVPKFVSSNCGNFYKYGIRHHILKLQKLKVFGLQTMAFGGPWQD